MVDIFSYFRGITSNFWGNQIVNEERTNTDRHVESHLSAQKRVKLWPSKYFVVLILAEHFVKGIQLMTLLSAREYYLHSSQQSDLVCITLCLFSTSLSRNNFSGIYDRCVEAELAIVYLSENKLNLTKFKQQHDLRLFEVQCVDRLVSLDYCQC